MDSFGQAKRSSDDHMATALSLVVRLQEQDSHRDYLYNDDNIIKKVIVIYN